jgi:hypothetical protein
MKPVNGEEIAGDSGKIANNYERRKRSCVKFNDPRIGANSRVVGFDASAF